MKKELTCIICPMGCTLKIEVREGELISLCGNACPRGKRYGEEEVLHPKRTLCTTMRCENGELVSVKTDKAIAKEHLFDAMKCINASIAPLPLDIGDVILKDVYGANIVATMTKRE